MSQFHNHRRWAIKQQDAARRLMAVKLEAERREREWIADWNNMYFGNWFAVRLAELGLSSTQGE